MSSLLRMIAIVISLVLVYRYRYRLLNALLAVNFIRRLVVSCRLAIPQLRKRVKSMI